MRVAVVGAGPAGVYAAEALVRYGDDVRIDVLDRLPTPFGLVRYGVAPDHPRTQTISAALASVLEDPAVRFLGNVDVGTDLPLAELRQHYRAVVITTGAAVDRRLGVTGEHLPGSVSATDFVAWYSGHPDAEADRFDLTARTVAVVGAGNVAGDVARMLARSTDELSTTDVPDHVLRTFAGSRVEDVHLVVRRGPVQARFTTRELRELGEMADADVLVDPAHLELDELSGAALAADPAARRNLELLRTWADRPPAGRSRRVHLHFFRRPVEVLGEHRVTGVRLERTTLSPDGSATGTGETHELDVQMVVRAVGYRGAPLAGLPFDPVSGVVPNDAGRVLRDGAPAPGVYVAGWAKRGPTGVIGTNKHDARETVRSLLEDAASLPSPSGDPEALWQLLAARGRPVVDWRGWLAIERAEGELGRAQGRDRAKIAERDTLVRLATEASPVSTR
ncbi:MAG: FAD-dependent oxidoreductase [Actinomycetes bacterium]